MNDSQKWLALAALAGLGWLIYLLSPVLTPFVAGALLAYLTDPLADRLETAGLKRTLAVILVFTGISLMAVTGLLVVLPMLEHQADRLVENLPAVATWIKNKALPLLRDRYGLRIQWGNLEQIPVLLGKHWQEAGGVAATVVNSLTHSGAVVISWAMNLLLIPVVTFYLLRDWDAMVTHIGDLLPRRLLPTASKLAKEVDEVLGAFLRGQFSVMLALGLFYVAGLWLVGLDMALLIGLLAGLISFIPYMGAAVGIVSASIAALAESGEPWSVVPVLTVFALGQLLEGSVLTPRLVGNRIGLHPVAVIFAVLAFGKLFGFLGVLLALPTASAVMVLVRHMHELYKGSMLYGVERQEAGTDHEAKD